MPAPDTRRYAAAALRLRRILHFPPNVCALLAAAGFDVFLVETSVAYWPVTG